MQDQTSKVHEPEHAYTPFMLATTMAKMNIEATVDSTIKGITLIKTGETEKIKLGSFLSSRDVMDQATKAGVRFVVCEQSCSLFGIPHRDSVLEANIAGQQLSTI